MIGKMLGIKNAGQLGQIGAAGDFDGDLLAAQSAVHVGAEGDAIGRAGQIANVPDMADDIRQIGAALPGAGRFEQETIEEIDADDAATIGDGLDHLVAQLPIRGDDRPAIAVRRDHRPLGQIKQLPETVLRQMRGVMDNAKAVEFGNELDALRCQRSRRARSAGIARLPPGQADDAQAGIVEGSHVVGRTDRIGALEEED